MAQCRKDKRLVGGPIVAGPVLVCIHQHLLKSNSNLILNLSVMKSDSPEITVSICCITYNHEKYIAQCLDSFLMQRTSFRYEIILGEDCSTDSTRSIAEAYARQYPDRIRLLTGPVNVGAQKNLLRVLKRAAGKYIALCDGDDFWTDPAKLQKQVDFLENNPSYTMCCS